MGLTYVYGMCMMYRRGVSHPLPFVCDQGAAEGPEQLRPTDAWVHLTGYVSVSVYIFIWHVLRSLHTLPHIYAICMYTDAILHGVETRTSSPLQISRDPDSLGCVGVSGLYPTGQCIAAYSMALYMCINCIVCTYIVTQTCI